MYGGSGCEDAPGKAKRTRPWFGIKAHTALGCVQTTRDDNKKTDATTYIYLRPYISIEDNAFGGVTP